MDDTPNMADLFGKMAEMQQRMADTQEALAQERVTAEVGGGMVRVTADGSGRVVEVKLEPAVVNPDEMEMLEDLLIAGVNKALEEAEAVKTRKLQEAASTMLPPGLDLGGLGL
ncbi:MAG: YbaB/EbfC family nucleoid-associated protein [Rubricoccaceae bacterium]|nr:YbaB/EbfC family nucleoid-associated protein [Rubricoccaceae bacterium]